jgi:hypothetical protein
VWRIAESFPQPSTEGQLDFSIVSFSAARDTAALALLE